MAHLRVRVFGKLYLQNGDRRLGHFPTKRVEELLGLLVINQRTQIPRETLIEQLWPATPPANGRANLSTTVWRLRSTLDKIGAPADGYIKSGRDWIAFSPSQPISIDQIEFEKYLDEADQCQNENELENHLRSAVALYKGSFCDGIFSEWCLAERERLERRYLKALGVLMRLHIEQAQFGKAVPIGKKIIGLDHLREEVHRALMFCYWKLGRRSESVRQFQTCAQLLQRELNILPMPETVQLFRSILEERVAEQFADGSLPSAYQLRLEEAFDNFLAAADDLDVVLSEKKKHPKRREVISAL